jgi:phenylethanolamine N-methyltransferase
MTISLSNARFAETFRARDYLDEYYPDREIGRENVAALEFYHLACRELSGQTWLEVGGGPTLYQLVSASARVRSIVFSDYVEENLASVGSWLQAEGPGRWHDYIDAALRLEGLLVPTRADIDQRARLMRNKITELRRLDIKDPVSLADLEDRFDVVNSSFCIDSVTNDIQEWQVLLGRLDGAVRTGGTLILCSLGGSTAYQVGGEIFPAVDLDEELILASLADLGYDTFSALVRVIAADDRHLRSYHSLICVKVVKL